MVNTDEQAAVDLCPVRPVRMFHVKHTDDFHTVTTHNSRRLPDGHLQLDEVQRGDRSEHRRSGVEYDRVRCPACDRGSPPTTLAKTDQNTSGESTSLIRDTH